MSPIGLAVLIAGPIFAASGPAPVASKSLAAAAGPEYGAGVSGLDRGRQYSLTSRDLYAAVVAAVEAAGMDVDLHDDARQAFRTLDARFSRKVFAAVPRSERFRADRFRLEVFVPPGREPGRLYVDVVETASPGDSTSFTHPEVARWFFAFLEARLDETGQPVPDADPGCQGPPASGGAQAIANLPAQVIEVTKSVAVFPARGRPEGRGSSEILLVGKVNSDGVVTGIRIAQGKEANSDLWRAAALSAFLWRFLPEMRNGCPVSSMQGISIQFIVK